MKPNNLPETTIIEYISDKGIKVTGEIKAIVEKTPTCTTYAVLQHNTDGTKNFVYVPCRKIENVLGNTLESPYMPAAEACKILDTQVPDSMDYETHSALHKIKNLVGGDIMEFVKKKLHYNDLELCKSLAAEQIDAVAMAIYQIEEKHQGFIVGDQTGIGKGRIAAAIIRYGALQKKKPIFLTEKPNLFSDIYRDLKAIGSGDLQPFIVNADDSKTDIKNEEGDVVYSAPSKSVQDRAFKSQVIPSGYDWVCATYSQFNSIDRKPTKPMFLAAIAQDNIIIMDEAHNASGLSNTGSFMMSVLKNTRGVVFLSATFAKRPDNMPLYAVKTAMQNTKMETEDFVTAIVSGGVALQEVLSSQLVAEGQMIRRERSFEGIEVNWLTLDKEEQVHRAIADNITTVMRDIIAFQKDYVNPMIDAMSAQIAADGEQAEQRKGNDEMGIVSTDVFSKIFNLTNQMLFSIKAESVAERAIVRLREGKNVVIAFANTMGSFLEQLMKEENVNIANGDTVPVDYGITLRRGLEGTLRYTVKLANGNSDYRQIEIQDMDPSGQAMYREISDKIKVISSGITVSPIDVIIDKIEKAGFRVGEVTGRKFNVKIDYKTNRGVVDNRKKLKTNDAFRMFNNNEIDCLLINQSGSTGASAHAIVTEKVPANKVKQRCMIILQAELNINTEVQKRGRVNRTGQILKPIYDYVMSAIPAEKRLMMMLQKKLKSLDANTTSNQKQNTKIIDYDDFLNKYGDKVCFDYLVENKNKNEAWFNIYEKIKGSAKEDENITVDNIAHRLTGYVAVLATKDQEEFYKDITERYKDYVDYLQSVDEYDLELETMPLQAKTITRDVAEYVGGEGFFGGSVYIEKCEVNILKKPFKKHEIEAMITQQLNGKTAAEQRDETLKDYENFTQLKLKKDIEKINSEKEEKIKNYTKNPNFKKYVKDGMSEKEARNTVVEELETQAQTKTENEEKAVQNRKSFFFPILKFFWVGRGLHIPNGFEGFDKGICLGFVVDKRKDNPYAPSAVKLKIGFANSKKYIPYTLTKEFIDKIHAIKGASAELSDWQANDIISDWDKLIRESSSDRGIRYIVTGNLLKAAASYRGKCIDFTTISGERKKGILLPENYKQEEGKNNNVVLPIDKAKSIIKGMTDGFQTNTTNGISIMRTYSMYRISTGISKQKYGHIYLNENLLNIVLNNRFEKVSDKMVAKIDLDDIDILIDTLAKEFQCQVEVSRAQFNQIEQSLPVEVEDEVIFSEIITDFVNNFKSKDFTTVRNKIRNSNLDKRKIGVADLLRENKITAAEWIKEFGDMQVSEKDISDYIANFLERKISEKDKKDDTKLSVPELLIAELELFENSENLVSSFKNFNDISDNEKIDEDVLYEFAGRSQNSKKNLKGIHPKIKFING